MPIVNLYFPALGTTLPTDHGYALYSSLAQIVPSLHAPEYPIVIGSIAGDYTGNATLRLDPRRSFLRLRLPAEQIASVLPLAGKQLDFAGHRVRLGVPRVLPLVPAPSLIARLVTIKTKERATDPGAFLTAARRQLDELGIQSEAAIPQVRQGPHAGEPRRRVLWIRDKRVIGYSLQVTELTAEESIKLQENGLGGRRKMGCGFFVPTKERGANS